MRKIMIGFGVLVALVACTMQTRHRGYVFPPDLETQVAKIKTVSDLQKRIGDPQAKTMYGDEVWIYFSGDENYRGPLKHTFTNETVLLAWVRGNSVTKTQILHDVDLPDVAIADGETKIPAEIELNAFQELFNNVGRFSPAGIGQ